ncbi:MAG: winged helix-turn-helix domain-containing protein [Acidobacteriaceae bacterium]|jgi:DNA-binding winged helix-turn-helix (wHTH) protein
MEESAYRFSEFSLFPSERRISRAGKSIPLPPKAFDAVHLLVRNHGRLVLRQEIVGTLWPDVHVTGANLTNTIVLLRKVLGRDAIQTVSKYGYRFTLPVLGEPGVKAAAYASFVRGKELAAERSLDSVLRARDLFSLCVANDPHFAAAWAWLGRCYRLLEKFRAGPSINQDLAVAALQRALAIEPGLACAHHFYTQLQADSGEAQQAMTRLVARLKQQGEDPETFAGLVHVLRFCGLLEESVVAHKRAVALDPTIMTSVAHTHFLEGEYAQVLETYTARHYYLDAAAWAALGKTGHARALLSARLAEPELSPLMSGLMASLLAVLEGRPQAAAGIMTETEVVHEPEVLFYFARHFAMLGLPAPAIESLRRARLAGFCSSRALERDAAFAALRAHPGFDRERQASKELETASDRALRNAFGGNFLACVGAPRRTPALRPA